MHPEAGAWLGPCWPWGLTWGASPEHTARTHPSPPAHATDRKVFLQRFLAGKVQVNSTFWAWQLIELLFMAHI